MRLGRTTLVRLAVVALLAGSMVAIASPPASATGLTSRRCRTILTGDGLRRMDVCARGWVSGGVDQTRGVVEMHTYRKMCDRADSST
jgi:hypothetical protein